MGVYINMETPFCCLVCPCSGTDNTEDGNEVWVCEASKLRQLTTEDKIERRPEWCPLVPVPPHGDLIDRDKLEKDIDNYIGGEESRSRFHHWVQVQNTVIPMDKETDK